MAIRYFTSWMRYPDYKLKAHREKGLYVVSREGELITYNPFDCRDGILLALLRIGFAPSEEQVLDFCNQFGLPGFGQAVIQKEYEDSTVKFYPDNVLGRKALHEAELMDLLFPFDLCSHRVKRGHEMRMTDRWERRPPDSLWPLFEPGYAEQVEWIINYASLLYRMLLRTYQCDPFEYTLGNAKSGLAFDGQVRSVWHFDSLKTAVDILFMELLQNPRPAVRLCEHCHNPMLVSAGTRSRYCSESCRNVENVKRSRQRKRDAQP